MPDKKKKKIETTKGRTKVSNDRELSTEDLEKVSGGRMKNITSNMISIDDDGGTKPPIP